LLRSTHTCFSCIQYLTGILAGLIIWWYKAANSLANQFEDAMVADEVEEE